MHCSLYWLILLSNNSLGRATLMYGVLVVGNEGWEEGMRVGRSFGVRREQMKAQEKDREQDGLQVIEESLLKMKNTFNEQFKVGIVLWGWQEVFHYNDANL